ncbi:DpnD/PcfM family protein [Ruminococcus albus]|uniref:DpnD/PcfM-like C-terminal domain-containing protein n=1 Tax=Ruminococcus albus 8 TaxID=246199 RepID=E9SC95_RUMAL|nr:DpnD/PcfM family protein [Ruminococcus albus]EGC03093.1 hypothetical protein CUS_4481 [Ruminococcus albus 8]MCC3351883.1 DpnD/PcfM family protein [Ruminococcus albus 8]
MKEFNVIITETLRKVVTVEAETAEDAEEIVDAAWHNSEYILEAEDFDGVEFTVQNEKDGVKIEEINVEDNSIDTSKDRPYDSLYDMYYDEFDDYEK